MLKRFTQPLRGSGQRGGSPYASRKPPRCHESISYVGEYGSPRVRGSAWELKFDAERGLLGGFGGLLGGVWGVLGAFGRRWGVLGGSWGFLGGLLLSWLRFGGSLGATWGLKGFEKRSVGDFWCHLEPVLAPKEPPGPFRKCTKTSPRGTPKHPQEHL